MVWDCKTLIVMKTPFCLFCNTSFILLICIRLIGLRLLFCCSDHDIQYWELIVANKSGITVKFTDTNSISCVSTCWIHFEVWQICDLSPLDYDYFIPATCQLRERLKTMPSCHSCHPCHHTTHAQTCQHAITPPMCNHATIPPMPSHHPCATMPLMPPMPLHHLCATMPQYHHAVCCIIVFCCWLSFTSVPFYQNWVSAAVVQVSVIRESLWYSDPWGKRMRINVIGHQCDRASMWSGINVMGHQCDGASMGPGINVIGHQCDRASMWLGINVIGHQFDRASMWSGIHVIRHQCDLESSSSFCICSRMFIPLHNYLDILAFTGLRRCLACVLFIDAGGKTKGLACYL